MRHSYIRFVRLSSCYIGSALGIAHGEGAPPAVGPLLLVQPVGVAEASLKCVACQGWPLLRILSKAKHVVDDLQEDWIGLRQLDEAGRVSLEECPGRHMHVTCHWFGTHVIQAHLKA